MEKLIVATIPFFIFFIGLEIYLTVKLKRPYYNVKDSFGSLGTGILSQLISLVSKIILLAAYVFVFDHLNIVGYLGLNIWSQDINTLHGVVSWIIVFFLVDLIYYIYHRHSHLVNILWMTHIVHHSSEEYNLTTALRQSTFATFFNFPYFAMLAIIGVPPLMMFLCYGINLVYQFFIHTRLVPKLWWPIEAVMNTPSHHRVHHGRQTKYLDSNYAGVFIIWDRLFGSFVEEEEEPNYGIFPRFQSYDPVRANFHPMVETVTYFRAAKGLDKFRVLFSGPLWTYETFKKGKNLNIRDTGTIADRYTILLFAAAFIASVIVLFAQNLPFYGKIICVLTGVIGLRVMGKRLDRKPNP